MRKIWVLFDLLAWQLADAQLFVSQMNSHWSKHIDLGSKLESDWEAALEAYSKSYPEEAAEFKQLISLELPAGWDTSLPVRPKSYTFHCTMQTDLVLKY